VTTLRCSSLDRVLSCNGSLTLVPLLPPRPDSAESREGVAIHWLAHSRIKEELGAEGDIGPQPDLKPAAFSKWIADYYVDTVRSVVPSDWSLDCEVDLSATFPRFRLTGHPDDIALSPDLTAAIGLDLKAGYIPVDAAECNWQVMGYGVLLKRAYPTLRRLKYFIVQPRNDEDEGYQRVSFVEVAPTEDDPDPLARWVTTLEAAVCCALDNAMETDSSYSACRWCPVPILKCPSLLAEFYQMKQKLTPEFLEAVRKAPDDATLADIVIAARLLAKPIEDAEEMLKERMRKGPVVSGSGKTCRIKVSGGRPKVVNPLGYYQNLKIALPSEEAQAKCMSFKKAEAIEQIAVLRGIPKTSKDGESATAVYSAVLEPMTEPTVREMIVVE
jgi:hypothetical protein